MPALYEVTATALNLRAAPQAGAAIVTVLRKGQACVASGPQDNGWLPVVFDHHAGYVSSAFVRAVSGADGGAMSALPAPAPLPPAAPDAQPAPAAPGVEVKQRDPSQLHPRFRDALGTLLERLAAAGAPFRVFEAYRTPERQEWLYAQGRTRPGGKVTNARAWQSYHQYGLGADLVLFVNGQWSWSDEGALKAHWQKLKQLAPEVGLRQLSFEMPHVELPVTLAEATGAALLGEGDEGWHDNLALCCERWRSAGGQGAPDLHVAERPVLAGST